MIVLFVLVVPYIHGMGALQFEILSGVVCFALGSATVALAYWLAKRTGNGVVTALGVFNWLLPLAILQMFPAFFLMNLGNLQLLMLDARWLFPLVFMYALCLIYTLPFIAVVWFALVIRSFAQKRKMQSNTDSTGGAE